MTLTVILAAIVVVLYFQYASLIKRRNSVLEAVAGIDAQFQMRHDLIPNILAIATKYMEHERELISSVTELRTRANAPYDKTNAAAISDHIAQASQLSEQMGRLQISMEAYPTLKADTQMTEAMKSYNEVESRLSAARRAYNASVTDLNNAVQIFPGSLIASLISVKPMPFFAADEATKAPVSAAELLK